MSYDPEDAPLLMRSIAPDVYLVTGGPTEPRVGAPALVPLPADAFGARTPRLKHGRKPPGHPFNKPGTRRTVTAPITDRGARREPCGCGSGRPYKHCCERKVVVEPGHTRHTYATFEPKAAA